MRIVDIDDDLLRRACTVSSRSINAQDSFFGQRRRCARWDSRAARWILRRHGGRGWRRTSCCMAAGRIWSGARAVETVPRLASPSPAVWCF